MRETGGLGNKMEELSKGHSNQGFAETEMVDESRRRDKDRVNRSRLCVPCLFGVLQAD